jgi:hypothetical protein
MFPRSSCAALYVAGCLVAAPVPLPAQAQEAPVLRGKWRPWPDNGAFIVGRGHPGLGERPAWAPVLQNGHSLLFADIRPKFFDEEERDAGIARDEDVGAADLPPAIWFGLNRRHNLRSNDFGRALFAGERLAPDWAGRLDGHSGRMDVGGATDSPMQAVEEGDAEEEADATEGVAILLLSRLDSAVLWGGDPAWAYRMPLEREGLARLAAAEPDEILLLALPEEEARAPLADMPAAAKPAKEEAGPPLRPERRVENTPAGQHDPRPTFDAGALYDDASNSQADASADLPAEAGLDLTDTVASIPDDADATPPEGKCLINLGGLAGKIGFVEADGSAANCN